MLSISLDSQKLLEYLKQDKRLLAMVAPSFPVDFTESQIVYSLRALGFDKVVDLSLSIATVNKMYESMFSKDPDKLFISANCPATVSLVKSKFPELANNIAPVISPMVCMSKICQKQFPGYLNIFIGPCLAKKEEAKKYPDSIALALTYKEIAEIFKDQSIDYKTHLNSSETFDDFHDDYLNVFPESGGVKATIFNGGLTYKKVLVADGLKELLELLTNAKDKKIDKNIRFLDVLFCKGGCIGGPGIKNTTTLNAYKRRLLEYRQKKGNLPLCSEADVT